MPLITQTPRLIIRTFKPEEEETYQQMLADERVNVHLPKRNREQVHHIFQDILATEAAVFNRWAIIDATDGGFIGMGLLRFYHDEPHRLEIGYCLNQKYWGQGIATELCKALLDYARDKADETVTTLVAVTTPTNYASQNVLQKTGLIKYDNFFEDGEELCFLAMPVR